MKIAKTVGGGPKTEEEAMALMESATGPPTFEEKDELPVKYKDESTSGLTADVKEGADNAFPFDLTD